MIIKTLDGFIARKDLTGLCDAIDSYVLNPDKKPILRATQNLTRNFEIPPHMLDITPTTKVEMDHRRRILQMGCRANVLYKQYKHLYWKNQDLLFDMLRQLQAAVIAGDSLEDIRPEMMQDFRYGRVKIVLNEITLHLASVLRDRQINLKLV